MLRQGAKIVEKIDDIWNEISVWSKKLSKISVNTTSFREESEITIANNEQKADHQVILDLLSDVPMHIDQITIHSSLPVAVLALALLELQLEGKILQIPGQHYVLAR